MDSGQLTLGQVMHRARREFGYREVESRERTGVETTTYAELPARNLATARARRSRSASSLFTLVTGSAGSARSTPAGPEGGVDGRPVSRRQVERLCFATVPSGQESRSVGH
jgi:hypothetical protein